MSSLKRLFSDAFTYASDFVNSHRTHTCSEHFHIHPENPQFNVIRPCVGASHSRPHYVCSTCVATASAFIYKPMPRGGRVASQGRTNRGVQPVLTKDQYKLLCLHCTAAAIQSHGLGSKGCTCGSIDTDPWLCFECRDMMGFRGRVALADIDDLEVNVNKQARFGAGDQKLCPGCEGFFEVDWFRHAAVCLGCLGIRTTGLRVDERAIFEYAAKKVRNAPFAPLSGPRMVGSAGCMLEADENSPTSSLMSSL